MKNENIITRILFWVGFYNKDDQEEIVKERESMLQTKQVNAQVTGIVHNKLIHQLDVTTRTAIAMGLVKNKEKGRLNGSY